MRPPPNDLASRVESENGYATMGQSRVKVGHSFFEQMSLGTALNGQNLLDLGFSQGQTRSKILG